MPRKEDRWQNIEEILSFWDNENRIEEEKLQRKGLLRKTIFAVVVALLVVVGISAWCVSRKREVTFADALPWIVSAFLEMCMKLDSSA